MQRLIPGSDSATERLARESLRTIARNSTDPVLRDLVDDVLAGRRPLRELLGEPEMQQRIATGLARVREQWEQLTPQERAGQVARR